MLNRFPVAGPIILTVPGITDVQVGANTVGPEVRYTWPKSYVCSALWLSTRVPTLTLISNVKLRMVDDDSNEIFSDGRGTVSNGNALALIGRQLRWQSFRRIIRGGERWKFQVENQNGAPVIPWLGFRVEELVRDPSVEDIRRAYVIARLV